MRTKKNQERTCENDIMLLLPLEIQGWKVATAGELSPGRLGIKFL